MEIWEFDDWCRNRALREANVLKMIGIRRLMHIERLRWCGSEIKGGVKNEAEEEGLIGAYNRSEDLSSRIVARGIVDGIFGEGE